MAQTYEQQLTEAREALIVSGIQSPISECDGRAVMLPENWSVAEGISVLVEQRRRLLDDRQLAEESRQAHARELAEAREPVVPQGPTDTEMLDWLEAAPKLGFYSPSHRYSTKMDCYRWFAKGEYFTSLRDAVRAAMKEGSR